MQYKSKSFMLSLFLFIFSLTNMTVLVDSKGPGGWPSTTGNPSGGGRNNGPRRMMEDMDLDEE